MTNEIAPENADRKCGPNAERDIRGRFGRGNSGKPRGSRNRVTAMAEKLIGDQAQEIVQKTLDLGLAGNGAILIALLRTFVPPSKERAMPVKFRLPPLKTAADALAAVGAIAAGVAEGKLDADAAKTLTSLVTEFRQTLEAVDHGERLKAIEARLEGVNGEQP